MKKFAGAKNLEKAKENYRFDREAEILYFSVREPFSGTIARVRVAEKKLCLIV